MDEASSVVTVVAVCNSVGGSVFLTYHRGAGGEYRSVSRLGLLIRNRWMSRLQDHSGCPGMR